MGRVCPWFWGELVVELESEVQAWRVHSSTQTAAQRCRCKLKTASDGILLCCLQNAHHFEYYCTQKKSYREG